MILVLWRWCDKALCKHKHCEEFLWWDSNGVGHISHGTVVNFYAGVEFLGQLCLLNWMMEHFDFLHRDEKNHRVKAPLRYGYDHASLSASHTARFFDQCKTLIYWSRDMLNFDFPEKVQGQVSPWHFVYDFSRKMFLMLCSIKWPNFIVWFWQYLNYNFLLTKLWCHKIWS